MYYFSSIFCILGLNAIILWKIVGKNNSPKPNNAPLPNSFAKQNLFIIAMTIIANQPKTGNSQNSMRKGDNPQT